MTKYNLIICSKTIGYTSTIMRSKTFNECLDWIIDKILPTDKVQDITFRDGTLGVEKISKFGSVYFYRIDEIKTIKDNK